MEWVESITRSIQYLEEHILESDVVEQVSGQVGISPIYLQQGFKIMTEISMAEYVRNRRLYMAALTMLTGEKKVIDVAFEYGYDTPESFTKAFIRFHGVSPTALRKDPTKIKVFLPLKIVISLQGGNEMDYVVEKMDSFKLIGFAKDFDTERGFQDAPKFWEEFGQKYMAPLCSGKVPQNEVEETICNCKVGEYGICIDDILGKDQFRYMIGGIYTEGEVPEEMAVYEVPAMDWAKFRCIGPMPVAIQSVNRKIFKEWLPAHPEYEIAKGINIEWYSAGDNQTTDYESAIWIPVKKKL